MILLFQNKKKVFIIGAVIILLAAATLYVYFYFFRKPAQIVQTSPETQITHPPCLGDDEATIFQYIGAPHMATSSNIIISDKITNKEKFHFKIDNLFVNHGHPYEFRKCGIYVIKEFNSDYKNGKFPPGFKIELWRYKYNGEGMPILKFAGENEKGEPTVYYSYDFRTDFLEVFLALIEGYSGDIDNFATIIKEIETKNDIFSLKYKDIINKYPDLEGVFGLQGWTKDSRYFWGDLFDGAPVFGFYRIERDTWKVDIFSAPPNTQGGDALNSELGYITYTDGAPWSGDADTDEMYRQQWKKEGRKVHFYLYNLLTKEQILLATIDDPRWYFQPQWISDSELKYSDPEKGEVIYKIP